LLKAFSAKKAAKQAYAVAVKRGTVSPLLLRIWAVNMLALAILVGGILYSGNYQDRILQAELDAMLSQAKIISSAVAENAVVIDNNDRNILSPLLARMMVRRLSETVENRTRVFSVSETLLADSRTLLAGKNDKIINADELSMPAAEDTSWWEPAISAAFDVIDLAHERRLYPPYGEQQVQKAGQYDVAAKALRGEKSAQVWRLSKGGLILAVAVPVEHSNRVLGAVMLSRTNASVDRAIYDVRMNIMKIFFVTLLVTTLLSLYLARAIARPIRQLANAADVLRRGQSNQMGVSGISTLLRGEAIPDMTARRDEIGDLSGALRSLTSALARRIVDIEHFAADVAHELKNPLTSLRSAVETAETVQDPSVREKMMRIVRDDVDRMTRLITDISSASRLDAELGRAELEPVDIGKKLQQLVDGYNHGIAAERGIRVNIMLNDEDIIVLGVRGRLMQVFHNLLDNAISFSPEGGEVSISVSKSGRWAQISVSDNGPGIPENKLETVFDRFYSERPKTEKFGTHSGLGLSISKQIIDAHQGSIWAENITGQDGQAVGARFTVQLILAGR